jgi:hypothetical protein
MIKRLLLTSALLVQAAMLFAQDVEKGTIKKATTAKPSRDFLMLQFTYEGWSNHPDSIKSAGFGRGFNGYICYDFPIKNSHFSFAPGIGIGTSNIYFDNKELILADTVAYFVNERKDYKKFKLTTAYLEAPFELRYFGNKINRNKGFKAAVGLRVGTLIGAHTKGKLKTGGVVEKINTKSNLENWRFAGTVRLGWGNFTVLGTYNLNTLFKENQGPPITPYSIGLCITGL